MAALKRTSVALIGLALLAGCAPSQPTAVPLPPTAERVVITLPPRPTEIGVSATDQVRGELSAPITWTLYGDFTAPATVELARNLLILLERYPAEIRIVWRHYPRLGNQASLLAAQASHAAGKQGKFWQMHDQLLATQADWFNLPPESLRNTLISYAQQVGVADLTTFSTDLDSTETLDLMRRAAQEGALRGFRSSPALLLRDQPYSGRIDEFGLDGAVKLILLERRQFDQQPALQIDLDKRYNATLITEKGEVQIELFPRTAPAAVNNFVFLSRQGWYNDITFHLVTSLLVQTGDPSGTGLGTAGYFIFDESDNGLTFDREGLVAMASQRGIRNSASSQFFITLGPMPPEGYNGQFTIFGRVTAGMDVLRALRARDPFDVLRDPNPPPGDRLIRVDIIESPQNP